MMVPLDLRETSRGRGRLVLLVVVSSCTEEEDEDTEGLCEVRGGGVVESIVGKGMVDGGEAIVYVCVRFESTRR